jgi:hypothetical protein
MDEDTDRFSPPYNWCDGNCAQCPLSDTCPVATRTAGRRWTHRARGRNPDRLDVQLDDVNDSLKSAMKMLEQDAARLGVDLRAPVVKAPTRLENSRIRSVSMDHTLALFRLLDAVDESDASLRSLREILGRASALIGAKMARIGATDSDTWRFDGIPNLLLVEHVDAALRREIEAVAERLPADLLRSYVETRDRLYSLTAQWFDTITAADRDDLDELISEDRAPSPFAQCDIGDDEDDEA